MADGASKAKSPSGTTKRRCSALGTIAKRLQNARRQPNTVKTNLQNNALLM